MNGKLYIGKSDDIDRRWGEHKTITRGGPKKYPNKYQLINVAMSKYGIENFSITIIGSYDNEQESLDNEKNFMTQYKSEGYILYNQTDGGEGMSGYRHTEEAKNKIAKYQNGKKQSKETIQKRVAKNIGQKRSDESKKKISGINSASAKLIWEDIYLIRKLRNEGLSYLSISMQFPVCSQTIARICRNETWKVII